MNDLLQFDKQFLNDNVKLVAGIDEVGRGPLAGPVVVACVCLPLDEKIEGIFDSKKISEKKRQALYDKILEKAISYSIVQMDNHQIDEINILQATKRCMEQSILNLCVEPDLVLVDAVKLTSSFNCMSITKGDEQSYHIAAASILAKVFRDKLMCEMDKKFPLFGFCKNKGYGTAFHIEAIKKHGICEIHRRTFVKNFYEFKS